MSNEEIEKKQGKVIVISGSSGAGKGTVLKRVFAMLPDLKLSVSATTRAPRAGETNGKEYFFLTKTEFEKMIENNGFVEYTTTYTNYYGTPKTQLESALENGERLVLEINVVGAVNIKSNFPQATTVFITPPSMQVLYERLKNRGTETDDSLQKRMAETANEIEYIEKYDYVVLNDSVEQCAKDVVAIINGDEKAKQFETKNNTNIIYALKGENLL